MKFSHSRKIVKFHRGVNYIFFKPLIPLSGYLFVSVIVCLQMYSIHWRDKLLNRWKETGKTALDIIHSQRAVIKQQQYKLLEYERDSGFILMPGEERTFEFTIPIEIPKDSITSLKQ